MKERPILMGAPMVRAILNGRKTQTRRVVKPQPAHSCRYAMSGDGIHALHLSDVPGREIVPVHARTASHKLPCPYGVVGDRLWVRETFRVIGWDEGGDITVVYLADGATGTVRADVDDFDVWVERQSSRMMRAGARMMQRDLDGNAVPADGGRDDCWIEMPEGVEPPSTPSIHMPRWASRITLTITDVRVQRVQDISNNDAMAEGVERSKGGQWLDYESDGKGCVYSAVNGFHSLWDHINGAGAWARNPWVWALTFRRE